ncbi:exodeoxyribonuclease VII small subunit [Lysinibacillus sp. BW-2-10]|uniref:exodeoxyribonuclease VII small subunit n=1 Tax=Lysinibacillus sp. BW-2-10 TaxID=2590030 RepID=UPI001180100F|nr:exodeoxyribonuclease VII small subunit [Lysinibacillus sp. BW-2-10]TSI08585.1 exodeoxyribonuclease VII small subunit [Lysinibacillus sp. BW-2-10]
MEKQQNFAIAMTELEDIVRKLEQGDVPLEEAIDLYKKGMELSHFCHEKLQNAEKQLISIVNENGEIQRFDPTNGEDNE